VAEKTQGEEKAVKIAGRGWFGDASEDTRLGHPQVGHPAHPNNKVPSLRPASVG